MSRQAKRARSDPAQDSLWSVDFDNRGDLESVVNSIKHLAMPSVTFRVVSLDETGFQGLRAEVASSNLTSLLRAQVAAKVNLQIPQATFTVSCDSFLGILKGSGKPQFRLNISQKKEDPGVYIRTYDTFDSSYVSSTRLQTLLEEEFEPIDLDSMDFDYRIRVELPFFKALVKNNRDLGCETIKIQIAKTPEAHDSNETGTIVRFVCQTDTIMDVKEVQTVSLCSGDSEATHSISLDEDHDGQVERLEYEDLEQKLDMCFDLAMVYSFLKSVDQKGKLKMLLNPESPLLFKLGLSSEQSFIYYLQAGRIDDAS